MHMSSRRLDAADDLERVDLTLPPPARLDAGAAEGALPLATQRALAKLLVACGLSADFIGEQRMWAAPVCLLVLISAVLPGITQIVWLAMSYLACHAGGAEQVGPLRLRQFVPGAAELARQRAMTQRGPRHEMGTLRTALRLGRQVSMQACFLRLEWVPACLWGVNARSI